MIRTLVLTLLIASVEAHALRASLLAQTENVEVEPVICWWRTNTPAIRVGEPFTVILTCSLLQTEAARVIADESRLEPSVVQIAPFEVVGGARARDLTTAGRRFVQFEYRLRVIAENVFASEAALPPLEITYRVESRVTGGDSLAGRDLTYALPPLTMRILSLVPPTAEDIREAPVATFAEVEGLRSRGTVFRVGAGALLALGALLLVLALVAAARRRRASRPASERTLPGATILNGVRRELSSIQEQVRASGWTPELTGRALAALRIVAAYAADRPIAQKHVNAAHGSNSVNSSNGQLVVNGRFGVSAIVSASLAATQADEFRDALAHLTAARYGRESDRDGRPAAADAQLDDALESAVRHANRLASDRPWLERVWPA